MYGFSDFHPVKASPGFGDPMGNHAPEACMAQANSQIGGTIGEKRNERVLTWQEPPRTTTPRASESWQRAVPCYGAIGLWVSSRAGPSVSATHVTSVLRHGAGGYPGARGNICSSSPALAKGGQINLHISSRGTLSAHDAVFLTESDIVSLLFTALNAMTNMSLSKVFLRYSLSSPVMARPCI